MKFINVFLGSCLGVVLYSITCAILYKTVAIDIPKEEYAIYVLIGYSIIGYFSTSYLGKRIYK